MAVHERRAEPIDFLFVASSVLTLNPSALAGVLVQSVWDDVRGVRFGSPIPSSPINFGSEGPKMSKSSRPTLGRSACADKANARFTAIVASEISSIIRNASYSSNLNAKS